MLDTLADGCLLFVDLTHPLAPHDDGVDWRGTFRPRPSTKRLRDTTASAVWWRFVLRLAEAATTGLFWSLAISLHETPYGLFQTQRSLWTVHSPSLLAAFTSMPQSPTLHSTSIYAVSLSRKPVTHLHTYAPELWNPDLFVGFFLCVAAA